MARKLRIRDGILQLEGKPRIRTGILQLGKKTKRRFNSSSLHDFSNNSANRQSFSTWKKKWKEKDKERDWNYENVEKLIITIEIETGQIR